MSYIDNKICGKFIFLLLVIFAVNASAQTDPVYLKIDYPEFIAADSSFEISVVPSKMISEYDKVHFYLSFENSIKLESVVKNDGNIDREIDFYIHDSDNFDESVAEIIFSGEFIKNYGDKSFQILFNFISEGAELSEIKFEVVTYRKVKSEHEDNLFDKLSYNVEIPSVQLEYYDVDESPGNSIIIGDQSYLDISIKNDELIDNLLVEFWARVSKKNKAFFDVVSNVDYDTLFSISKSFYKMINIPEVLNEHEFKEYFISDNSWNHYSVLLSASDQSAKLYVNGKSVYSAPYFSSTVLSNLNFIFASDTTGILELDQLRLMDFNSSIEKLFESKHYKNFSSDSSRVLFVQNFEVDDISKLAPVNNYIEINSNKVDLRKSSAPIFSRTPELTIKQYNNFYELDWENLDDENVEYYIVEKSVDGLRFESIYSILSDEDPENTYFFIDDKNKYNEVVYYRIKQFNKDGSFSYSPGVKMGMGQREMFTLEQNYPNPFNPTTSVSVEVLHASEFDVSIYDLVGTKIKILHRGPLAEGTHIFNFDGSNLTSGIYFFEVSSQSFSRAIKMILAK